MKIICQSQLEVVEVKAWEKHNPAGKQAWSLLVSIEITYGKHAEGRFGS